ARVNVTDDLPANFAWTVSETVDSDACAPVNPVAGGSELVCSPSNADFTLASGASITITITSTTDATSDDCGEIDNTAEVSSNLESTLTRTNNSSKATVTVQGAYLSIVKTATPATVEVGSPLEFTIVVTNS